MADTIKIPIKCPFETCPTECESPIFADGYEICEVGNTLTICLSFKGKLLTTIVMDKILANRLAKNITKQVGEKVKVEGDESHEEKIKESARG